MQTQAALDERSGLLIPQAPLVQSFKVAGPQWRLIGTVTYCCHTCGEFITRPWEVFFVDDTPGKEWASELTPPKTTLRTTTHHTAHLAEG